MLLNIFQAATTIPRGHVQTIFGELDPLPNKSLIKITCFTDQTTVAISHTKQLIDMVWKECKGSTELVNKD